jgi:hypothetical protein
MQVDLIATTFLSKANPIAQTHKIPPNYLGGTMGHEKSVASALDG